MNRFNVRTIVSILVLCFYCNNTTLGMQSTATPPVTPQPPTLTLLGNLGFGIGESLATALLTNWATAKLAPTESRLSEALFPGAGYIVPIGLAAISYGIEKFAERKEKLSRIRTGTSSWLWSHAKTWCSSAKNLILQGTITQALSTYISPVYQYIGTTTATTCNALTPLRPETCSYVADKTASSALTIASLTVTSCVEHLVSDHDVPQPRVHKSTLIQTPSTAIPLEEKQDFTNTTLKALPGNHLQGPQVNYFLATYGCDVEQLWRRLLSQTAQVKASANGNWQKFCATQLAHIHTKIAQAFTAASKKLPSTIDTLTDLVAPYIPFGKYPQQFDIDKKQLAKETASFSCTVIKEPRAIFNGIRNAVLSYFDPINLKIRYNKGDEAIFNCPLTPVFYQQTEDHTRVTITAYPQSRQDLLYPLQWESPIKLPRWFRITSATIPYAIMIGQILRAKPSAYFTADGSMCTTHHGQMYCTDGTSFSTTCSSPSSCLQELQEKRLTPQIALTLLELNPHEKNILKDITKRYRKLAQRYHPDRCAPEKRNECEKRFITIDSAYRYLLKKISHQSPHHSTPAAQQHVEKFEVDVLALPEK